jgi:hypothetical protein
MDNTRSSLTVEILVPGSYGSPSAIRNILADGWSGLPHNSDHQEQHSGVGKVYRLILSAEVKLLKLAILYLAVNTN